MRFASQIRIHLTASQMTERVATEREGSQGHFGGKVMLTAIDHLKLDVHRLGGMSIVNGGIGEGSYC